MTQGRPPELLPGRSAHDEAVRGLRVRLAGIGLVCLVLVLTALLSNPARTVALPTLGAPLIAAAVVSTRALLAQSRAQKREREAGYTTLNGREGLDLWQLDPRTGRVVREPRARPDR